MTKYMTVSRQSKPVQLVGPEQPPSATGLSEDISRRTGRTMTAIVRWIEEQEQISVSTG